MEKQVIEVGGTQVFSADWVFQQMQAQSIRIERASRIALVSAILAALCLGITVITILL